MAKLFDGEPYHDACWAEVEFPGDRPIPLILKDDEWWECHHCGEDITEEDY